MNRHHRRALACALAISSALFTTAITRADQPDRVPLPASVANTQHVTFQFDARAANERPKEIHLAGSFNHFSHTDNPMVPTSPGVYAVTIDLEPGIYHYKFLLDKDHWLNDPRADKSLEDADDHNNSGIIVGTDWRKLPKPAANAIDISGLAYDADFETDTNIASSSLVRFRIQTRIDDVQTVNVHYRTATETDWHIAPLTPIDETMGEESWGGVASLLSSDVKAADSKPSIQYYFELTDGSAKDFIASGDVMTKETVAQQSPYARDLQPKFETPDWAKHAVWYQIFPERFRNGDTSNDPPNTVKWTSRWYASLPGEAPGMQNFYQGAGNIWKRRYGGDFQGIREKLPYLRSLGITAIYLNPIFEADSMHKYDTRDYRHVDDFFGVKDSASKLVGETEDPKTWQWSDSDKLFLDFVADAHKQGFKVVLDGVFNHVGESHPFFQDVLKNGRNSKYADWFNITDWGNGGKPGTPGGIQWDGWGGKKNGSLIVIKKDPKIGMVHGPREHIFAITQRWLAPDGDVSRGVDGWRLDAANEVPHPFWVDWRKYVKSINPNAIIIGEIWSWSQAWLSGDQFDAVMNYQFAMPTQSFFADQKKALSPTKFEKRLAAVYYNYPLQVVLAQQNLFDSHDTDRFASRFVNPDHGYDQDNRVQEVGAKYNESKPTPVEWNRMRQAVAFQMSFAGAPMVYYGDEIGMWSSDDPNDRMPMWWDDLGSFDEPQYKFDHAQFEFYQRAIAIRRQLPALQTGGYHPTLADDAHGVFAFERDLPEQAVYVIINRSGDARNIEVPVADNSNSTNGLVNWLDPRQVDLVAADANSLDGRPTLAVKSNPTLINAHDGKIGVSLPAYGTAILSAAK